MEVLGIIPARGGSKSIPKKNIVPLAGKPLLIYTCEAALASKSLRRVILSTNDVSIADVGKKSGIEVPFMRPENLAQDATPTLPVLIHSLEYLKKNENYSPNIIVLLQPTSPFRTAKHIDDAVELLIKSDADTVVSVVEVPHQYNPASIMVLENEKFSQYVSGPLILRRQDKPVVYARNGPAVLVMRRETTLDKNMLYGSIVKPLVMNHTESVDIDTMFDLEFAEYIFQRNRKRNK